MTTTSSAAVDAVTSAAGAGGAEAPHATTTATQVGDFGGGGGRPRGGRGGRRDDYHQGAPAEHQRGGRGGGGSRRGEADNRRSGDQRRGQQGDDHPRGGDRRRGRGGRGDGRAEMGTAENAQRVMPPPRPRGDPRGAVDQGDQREQRRDNRNERRRSDAGQQHADGTQQTPANDRRQRNNNNNRNQQQRGPREGAVHTADGTDQPARQPQPRNRERRGENNRDKAPRGDENAAAAAAQQQPADKQRRQRNRNRKGGKSTTPRPTPVVTEPPHDEQAKPAGGRDSRRRENNNNKQRRPKHVDPDALVDVSAIAEATEVTATVQRPQPRAKKDRATEGQRQPHGKAKKGASDVNASTGHSDAFSDEIGAHRHSHVLPPENVHGHALQSASTEEAQMLEQLKEPDGAAALRGDDSSSANDDDDHSEKTDEDFSDTANERQKEYRAGGYHPVYVGELYNNRYRVVHKLGWGYFSTVWLVWDYEAGRFQAMKVQKSAQHYRDAAYDEIKLLTQIMGADPTSEHCCARMTDSFEHFGPHGTHVVMVFDVLGENLLKLMERYEYKGIPIPIVKAIAKQTLIGLRHIHSIDIIHTDLKPENVLLSNPKHAIANIMKRYSPPPLSSQLSLLERDRKMMTKAQRRRYDAKMRKLRSKAAEEEDQGEDDDAKEKDAEKPEENDENGDAAKSGDDSGASDAEGGSASGNVNSPTHPDMSAGAKAAEAAVNGEDSETDAEWEVQRFQEVCLADFGNSCWTYKQFADEVQTRQYRCPEVIIGDPYDTAIDLWSAACMFFELLTGEFLFDPKETGEYPRDEDHLALVMELLGPLPPNMACGSGKFRHQYFNSRGQLRHIKELRFWGLRDVLHKKYRFSKKKAAEIAEFLLPMLALDPRSRATAAEMLKEFDDFFHPVDDDFTPACFSTGESSDDDDADPQTLNYDAPRRTTGDDEEGDEDEDIARWLAKHPLLHEDRLAEVGLTLDDITTVLRGSTLEDADKQQLVEEIIERLQDDAVDDELHGDDEAEDSTEGTTTSDEEEETESESAAE
jgi:serine/threonine-protein kinase SRPK3